MKMIRNQRGFTLVEILTALVIIVLASICTLSYFQYGLGGIHQEGNRRAALEIARARMDQLMAASFSSVQPTTGSINPRLLTCSGTSCTTLIASSEPVSVNGVGGRQMKSTSQWQNDPAVLVTTEDVLLLSTKVWYRGDTADLDSNRVELRSLRAK